MQRLADIHLWPEGSAKNPTADDLARDAVRRTNETLDARGHMERPALRVYMPDEPVDSPCPAMIVCPGGGYTFLADKASEPVAEWFTKRGFVALVLRYRIAPARYPAPFADAARAVRLAKAHADDLGIDVQRLGMIGFSAGAHLTGMTGFTPNLTHDAEDDLIDAYSARPERIALAYAPTALRPGHWRRAHFYGGPESDLAVEQSMELARGVSSDAPPTFIFHTQPDEKAPIGGVLEVAAACIKQGVPLSLHTYPDCEHGVVMGERFPQVASWAGLLEDWLSDWGIHKMPIQVSN